jgi:thermitase
MTNPTPPWPLPDPRESDQITADRDAVRRQVEVLSAPDGLLDDDPDPDNVVMRIGRRSADAPRFSVVRRPDGPVLPAEHELVVQATDEQLRAVGGLLDGYTEIGRAGQARVFRNTGKTGDDLLADAERLRAARIEANVNPIAPLGYVMKADEFPGLTTVKKQFTGTGVDPTVRVAVIDTGRAAENRTDGWSTGVVAADTDPLNEVAPNNRNDYFSGHGTFTAGIVRQIAPRCEVVVYRFTGADGIGTDRDAADKMLKAAADAGDRRLIINASFGTPAVDGVPPLALRDAVARIAAEHPDVLIIASAGNDGGEDRLYPAGFSQHGVKAVGALNPDLTGAKYSNRGSWVHCSAVGVGVVSTFVAGLLPPEGDLGVADIRFGKNAWATWSGTSFTAPQISGAVAYLCSQQPGLRPKDAFTQLLTGRPTLDKFGTVVHVLRGTPTA